MADQWPPPYGGDDATRRIDPYGQQPQPSPATSSWGNPRFWVPFAAIIAIAAVAVAAVVVFVVDSGEPAEVAQTGGEVFLEPVGSEGEDPFTPSVSKPQPPVTNPGADPVASKPAAPANAPAPTPAAPGPTRDAPANDAPAPTAAPAPTRDAPVDAPSQTPTTTVRTANGDLPGLYGGTRDMTTCDPELLIKFLAENPDKGRAWAGVHGITPEQIPDYVRSLTPVLLRTDTRVTNHGFKDGRATVLQSVLQAGTAVLVDENGVPRVRCECGNPLKEPVAITGGAPVYVGAKWEQFAADKLVFIKASAAPIQQFVVWQLTGPTPGYYGRNPGWPIVDVAVAQRDPIKASSTPEVRTSVPTSAPTYIPTRQAPVPTHDPRPTSTYEPVPTHDPRPTSTYEPVPTHDPRPTSDYEPVPTHDPRPTSDYVPEVTPAYEPELTPAYEPELTPAFEPELTPAFEPELTPTFEQPR